jgi:Tol biopolymer transport system component
MSRISPDGRAVAFLELLDSDTVVLLTVPTAGGPPRELTRANAPIHLQEVDGHSWSHDSRYVYFFRRASANAPYEMFRVPASGGAEENMGLQNMELRDLHFSPDGTKISFSNGAFQRPEIWAMDNFLPANK